MWSELSPQSQEEAIGWFIINSDPELPVPWQVCSVTDPLMDIYIWVSICLASPLGSGDIKMTLGRKILLPPMEEEGQTMSPEEGPQK